MEARYSSYVCIERDSLAHKFPQIMRMQLACGPRVLCQLGNEVQSHFVKVKGVDVTLTLTVLHDIAGTAVDTDPLVLTG
ncbi:hypothetical protein H5410_002107 [Solanum commersonii]|uniref:Uncharacterized protein n=1 Tax=Solanum commersonii TaxID=4109 RepID=A0A9J6B0Y5_SOLCO|nr:hypothetical protein H5410_002107 [Solanum commersonii]